MENYLEEIGLCVVGIVSGAVICLLTAVPVYYLWNWLMPDIFNLPEITYWQSLGLALLCEILFKSHSNGSKSN